MQDDALVERVARAILETMNCAPISDEAWAAAKADNKNEDWQTMLNWGHAAIAAMPEIAALRADNDALRGKLTRAIDAADAILAPICAAVGKYLDPGYHVPDLVPELATYGVMLPSALFWELYQATDREALLGSKPA